MDAGFWHKKWEKNEIGFHESQVNSLLVAHFTSLSMKKNGRIFLPLCGKTLDVAWLLGQGYRVAGCELSRMAVEQLFLELGLKPTIVKFEHIVHFSAENIDIFVGDIFDLSRVRLGEIDAVYDRAALVALPVELRDRYVPHLIELTNTAPQLLIAYMYDQSLMSGPPFSVSNDEVLQRYQDHYSLKLLHSSSVEGGLKGKCAATESVWHLSDL